MSAEKTLQPVDAPLATEPGPLVSVLKGDPTEDELAALVASLMSLQKASAASSPSASRGSTWSDPATILGARPFGLTQGGWSQKP